jgi:hypothetical protein
MHSVSLSPDGHPSLFCCPTESINPEDCDFGLAGTGRADLGVGVGGEVKTGDVMVRWTAEKGKVVVMPHSELLGEGRV